MGTLMGSGQFTYELDEGWGKLPDGWTYHEVAAVGVDKQDNVYVFTRGEHSMIVFNSKGDFLDSWGEGVFTRAHGLTVGPDDMLYCTDDGDHTVRKCTPEGKILLQLGIPGKPAPYQSGEPFNRCTHVALSPDNEMYVSDGYGNSRVHKYSPEGKLLFSWGEPGTDPGQFNIVHNICADDEGYVYVADRENHRVQVFDANGQYETQWNNMHRPCALYMDKGTNPFCYIGELGPGVVVNKEIPNIGHRVIIMNSEGEIVARLGDRLAGEAPGQFIAPHGITVDSKGSIYVGEVSWTIMGRSLNPPRELRSLQKLVKRS
ncbi:MAG: peptidyl-alpha-hydroxyglycine alpha-amidating lyase family protein [Candidatus Binatia bacterium]|jgi:DNA-binding beta-propeller fold protein YncE|nr:peptidyl-alpha-hydroxyglycine alpha-amidating lyase family protein [Candidatus Binatia bacterium]